jgi:glyoxylase-like metal-dependent hydrolase (beta-lactamase superfamily II)
MDRSDRAKRRAYLSERGILPIRVPAPLIIDHTNVYYVDGAVGVLIDAGFSGPGSLDALREGLASIDRDISDIGLVLLTHGHRDHSGLAGKIKEISGAQIFLNPRDLFILGPDSFTHYLQRVFVYYRDMGVDPKTIEEMRTLSANDHARNRGDGSTDATAIDGTLVAGGRFESGAGTLTVIETPGHTQGSVSFQLEGGEVLFSGDLLSVTYDPLPLVLVEKDGDGWLNTYDDQLDSLRRLADLNPALMLPGHGGPIAQAGRLAARAMDAQKRAAAGLMEILGRDHEGSVAALASQIYPGAHGPALTNALNVVRGISAGLAREGRVEMDNGGGIVRLKR